MRLSRYLLFGMACLSLSSCFKEEPLNAECDIEAAWVHVDTPEDVFFNITDTLVDVMSAENTIVFTKKPDADVTAMSPRFRLTPGARITPENGSTHDFSNEQAVTYTVTSEDGSWTRTYRVMFAPPKVMLKYDFENYRLDGQYGKYYVWNEVDNNGNVINDIWATGNPGYFKAKSMTAKPDEYPTIPMDNGYDGKGVMLVTRSTGPFGMLGGRKMPIAAGNLFLGRFVDEFALTQTLKATEFGIRFNKEPRTFMGYYKYRPGDVVTNNENKPLEGVRDSAAIYSVLYLNHDADGNSVVLHGDDVMTNPNIVAVARLWNVRYTDEWTPFEVNFVYRKEMDKTLMENFGYNIAVVFSSSHNGDVFQGAVGSTLCVDKVSIVCIE